MNPSGIKPIPHKRVNGGMRVTLGEFDLTAQSLLAQDPLIVNNITRRWAVIGQQAAQLERDLAVHEFYTVQKIAGELDQRPGAKTPPPALARCRPKKPAIVRLANGRPAVRRRETRRRSGHEFLAGDRAILLGRCGRRQKTGLSGHQPGGLELPDSALSLALDRPHPRRPIRPEPASRRRFRKPQHDVSDRLAISQESRPRRANRRRSPGRLGPQRRVRTEIVGHGRRS